MDLAPAHLSFKIDIREPIELPDLLAFFSSLSSQFQDYMRQMHPDLASEAQLYVHEIRPGCIAGELIPIAMSMIEFMDRAIIVEDFARRWGTRLAAYFEPRGRDASAKRSDLKDILDATAAISRDPEASATVNAVSYENGKEDIRFSLKFDTKQARQAQIEASAHRQELEAKDTAEHERVLMTYVRPSKKGGPRAGERAIIPSVSQRDLPVYSASALAEQRIRHELQTRKAIFFKIAFIVDVNVDTRGTTPIAYRVMAVHDVFEMDDSESD